MADALTHRGPDFGDSWVDPSAGIALGHRRLSVLDLSPEGNQPMVSHSGRYRIVFNGEIYNFNEIRLRLQQHRGNVEYRGHSDTEVILSAFDEWGVVETVKLLVGMFAIAVWDQSLRLIHLIRDRLGEKPLYYAWRGPVFVFCSELKALECISEFDLAVDRDVLALYLRHNYVPSPYSIYRGVWKLPPGSILTVSASSSFDQKPAPQTYWRARDFIEEFPGVPRVNDLLHSSSVLEELLARSIRGQMVADVPLGAFLSGGIDSSTVVALMQAQSTKKVKTFSIGFEDKNFDESGHAMKVARILGTDHSELILKAQDAQAVIPRLGEIYDEPFADSSQIPTFLVAQMARREVTVCLSGDGGDELFGGYGRYQQAAKFWKMQRCIPEPLRRLLTRILKRSVLDEKCAFSSISSNLFALQQMVTNHEFSSFYRYFLSHTMFPSKFLIGTEDSWTDSRQALESVSDIGIWKQMMLIDIESYLPDDILVKVDRAAMAVSLETRVPLLDHRIVEYALRLPVSASLPGQDTKRVLREVLQKYVPREIFDRPKMGFGVPVADWIRGPLRNWAESYLCPTSLKASGYWNVKGVRKCWEEHLSGSQNRIGLIWGILMFEQWNASRIARKTMS